MALFKGFLGLFVCCLSANWAASQMISREVLDVSHGGSGRILLDDAQFAAEPPPPQECVVDFMNKDYSALNQCVIPFPKKTCCEGFMEVACPVITFINNMATDCASNMFMGIYTSNPTIPPGYFYDACLEGPQGIDCLPIIQRNKRKEQQLLLQHHHGSPQSLAARKAEIMRHHPKMFPQAP